MPQIVYGHVKREELSDFLARKVEKPYEAQWHGAFFTKNRKIWELNLGLGVNIPIWREKHIFTVDDKSLMVIFYTDYCREVSEVEIAWDIAQLRSLVTEYEMAYEVEVRIVRTVIQEPK